jgi:hypothetical protein
MNLHQPAGSEPADEEEEPVDGDDTDDASDTYRDDEEVPATEIRFVPSDILSRTYGRLYIASDRAITDASTYCLSASSCCSREYVQSSLRVSAVAPRQRG